MNRRVFLKAIGAALLPIFRATCGRVRPSDATWPSSAAWRQLNDIVGGNLSPVNFSLSLFKTDPQGAAAKAPAEARGNCSPPYYFDEKGIQRIKAGCLNGSGMIAGPFGASVPVAAKTAPTAAPSSPATKSTSTSKPAAGACDPPYYFEGKIRRLKLECL